MGHPVDDLAQDIREIDGSHDLGAGALAEELWEKGWVRLPSKYEEMSEFMEMDLPEEVASRLQTLINFAIATDRLKQTPLREGNYVEVLHQGVWVPGKVSSTGPGTMINVDTERGPVTAFQGKSRIRPA